MASQESVLHLQLDVVRGKKLYQHPDVVQTISPMVTVQTVGHGNRSFSTQAVNESADPFFNESFDIVFPCTPETTVQSVQFQFEIKDVTKEGSPLLIGSGTFGIKTGANILKKEELVIPVLPPDGAAHEQDGFGTMIFRYRVQVPKFTTPESNADVELPFVPVFSSAYPLVPLVAPFAWWSLTQDPDWKERFASLMLQCYANDKLDRKNPLKSLADIVVLRWKCKRSHQLFTKLRLSAEKFMKREAKLCFSPEEESAAKFRWKELSLARAVQHGHLRSKKISEAVEKMWLYYCTDVHYETATTHIGYELREKMNSTTFTRVQYEILDSAIVSLFVPTLPHNICDTIAHEDFAGDKEASPGAAQKEKNRLDQIEASEAAAVGPVITAARSSVKDAIARHAERSFSDAGIRPPASPSAQLFAALLHGVADFWVDTMTDAEYVAFLFALGPAVTAAKQRASLPTKDSGERKSSAKARRPASKGTPRSSRPSSGKV